MAEVTRADGDVRFIAETHAEALAVLEAARDMLMGDGLGRDTRLRPDVRLTISRDISSLTNRMTSAMALILLAKALAEGSAGEIVDRAGHAAHFHTELAAQRATPLVPHPEAPAELTALLSRADHLLDRLDRIKALIDQY